MEGRTSYDCDLDNLKATELRLGLPGTDTPDKLAPMASRGSKRAIAEADDEECGSNGTSSEDGSVGSSHESPPVAKVQVVGWPPVRSFRRNSFQARKTEVEGGGIYVKVSMDGAPYLRKIDLKVYKGYKELREELEEMFMCFSLGELSGMEGNIGCEYAVTYEDKDGDWMLVGDVPFEMFISSCKRLRIMKGSEARGLGSCL